MQQLQPNSTFQGGKYIIKKVLGQGGFGITYLAEHDLLGTKVAIKEFFMKDFCNREVTTSHVTVVTESGREQVDRFREKFLKEARSIAKLHHPNIVRISDVFEENGTAYYVMDYCEGGSLAEFLRLHPNGIEESSALKYIRQVASALSYIHERKMMHLDVKPANILLDGQGNAVLIDFGLAKQYDALSGSQTSTTPVGISHGYAPIEQYKMGGVSEFSPATDIYSLGATLYKLITGQTPPEAQVLLEEELPSFAATQNVATAIRKAMQVRRLDRPQSIKEWLNLLGGSSASKTGSTTTETSTPKQEVDDESTCIETSAWQEEEARRQGELQAKAEREAETADEAKRHAEEIELKSREKANLKADVGNNTQVEVSLGGNVILIILVLYYLWLIYYHTFIESGGKATYPYIISGVISVVGILLLILKQKKKIAINICIMGAIFHSLASILYVSDGFVQYYADFSYKVFLFDYLITISALPILFLLLAMKINQKGGKGWLSWPLYSILLLIVGFVFFNF